MPERHPGWVTGINDFEARLATGALVTSQQTTDTALDPLRVRSGIRDSAGSPGLVTLGTSKVTVKPFQAVIQDPARPGLGPYLVTLDAAKDLPLTAADPSLSRIDLIIAEIDPAVGSGFTVRVVEGQRSSTPQPPGVTNPLHLKLAQVQIPASTGTPTLTDLRQFTAALGGILPVRGSADLPSAAPDSMFIYRLDTKELQVRRGSSWETYRPPRRDAWHSFTLQNGWVNYEYVWSLAAYTMTEDGWVRLRGLVRAGDITKPIAVLPSAYCPKAVHMFVVKIHAGFGRIDVRPDGTVIGGPTGQGEINNLHASLDGICFPTY